MQAKTALPDSGLTLEQLAERVDTWCQENGISPASGQASERLSERTVRYYRTLGLLDGPADGVAGYGEKHFLQLVAVRLLQARGLALRRIRELVFGRSVVELKEVQRRGLREQRTAAAPPLARTAEELWRMIPLDPDFVLVSRRGESITPAQRAAILAALGRE